MRVLARVRLCFGFVLRLFFLTFSLPFDEVPRESATHLISSPSGALQTWIRPQLFLLSLAD